MASLPLVNFVLVHRVSAIAGANEGESVGDTWTSSHLRVTWTPV